MKRSSIAAVPRMRFFGPSDAEDERRAADPVCYGWRAAISGDFDQVAYARAFADVPTRQAQSRGICFSFRRSRHLGRRHQRWMHRSSDVGGQWMAVAKRNVRRAHGRASAQSAYDAAALPFQAPWELRSAARDKTLRLSCALASAMSECPYHSMCPTVEEP